MSSGVFWRTSALRLRPAQSFESRRGDPGVGCSRPAVHGSVRAHGILTVQRARQAVERQSHHAKALKSIVRDLEEWTRALPTREMMELDDAANNVSVPAQRRRPAAQGGGCYRADDP